MVDSSRPARRRFDEACPPLYTPTEHGTGRPKGAPPPKKKENQRGLDSRKSTKRQKTLAAGSSKRCLDPVARAAANAAPAGSAIRRSWALWLGCSGNALTRGADANPIGDARGFVFGVPLARNGMMRDWSLHQSEVKVTQAERPLTRGQCVDPGPDGAPLNTISVLHI